MHEDFDLVSINAVLILAQMFIYLFNHENRRVCMCIYTLPPLRLPWFRLDLVLGKKRFIYLFKLPLAEVALLKARKVS